MISKQGTSLEKCLFTSHLEKQMLQGKSGAIRMRVRPFESKIDIE
jgi:hypothetical protein